MKFELCIDSINSVAIASQAQVDRVELCSALHLGGLTPSYGLIKEALKFKNISHHLMIRPRAGNFIFNQNEVNLMLNDIAIAQELGVDGIVIGSLTLSGEIDTKICKKLISEAKGLEVTFHRAFDLCNNPQVALEQIIDLGCTRLLTSGLKSSAYLGKETIALLVQQSNGRIQIMAGAGINSNNAQDIVETTQIENIHFSAKKLKKVTACSDVVMGSNADYDNQMIETDLEEILKIKQSLIHY